MRVIGIDLVAGQPEGNRRATGGQPEGGPEAATERLREVVSNAPVYERFAAMVANSGQLPGTFTIYDGYDDFLARGSALIGSPEEVIEKIGRYHEAFGNSLISIGGHRGHLPQPEFAASLELFAAEVLPAVRTAFPDPPWPEPASVAAPVAP